LTRTGLIFTRIQEGATAGWADTTWPTRAGYSIPCAFMLGSSGGEPGGGNSLVAPERAVAVWSGRAALWVVQFVLCFLLFCIVVVAIPFVCCSVKLPLSQPTSFCLFLSILLCTPAGGGAAARHFYCRPQPNHNNAPSNLDYDSKILLHRGKKMWGKHTGTLDDCVFFKSKIRCTEGQFQKYNVLMPDYDPHILIFLCLID